MWNLRDIEEEINAVSRRALMDVFLKYLPSDGKILEAGCGLCGWLIRLKDLNYDIEGIDIDENVINRVKSLYPNVRAFVGDVTKTNYESNFIDAYISLGVVEHFEDGPEIPLKEAHRILKNNGILILAVPYNNISRRVFYHPLRNIYFSAKRLIGQEVFFAEYRYNKKEILRFIEEAGFQIVEVGSDDFIAKTESLGLWADWPYLRSSRPYELNLMGKVLAAIFSYSKWSCCAGIYIVAAKQ